MSELVKHKNKKKVKVLDETIPDLPDLNQIEIYDSDELSKDIVKNEDAESVSVDSKVEDEGEVVLNELSEDVVVKDENAEFASVDGKVAAEEVVLNEDVTVSNEDVTVSNEDVETINQFSNMINQNNKECENALSNPSTRQSTSIEIEKLYPSISQLVEMSQVKVEEADDKTIETIDLVSEAVQNPQAPLEEWVLPKPMPLTELMKYYQNESLSKVETMEKSLLSQMKEPFSLHPLFQLIENYQKALKNCFNVEISLKNLRSNTDSLENNLWRTEEKVGTSQGRCRDNAVAKTSYTFVEASFNQEAAKNIEKNLSEMTENSLDNIVMAKYEVGLHKILVDDYLIRIKESGGCTVTQEIRNSLTVLFHFIRRTPLCEEYTETLRGWVIFLAGFVVECGLDSDRLYVLWELLHCPAGVGAWAAGLVQLNDWDLSITGLAMIFGGRTCREEFLKLAKENVAGGGGGGGDGECSDWQLVDSEGEEDNGDQSGTCWLLKENDINSFLDQIPLSEIFKKSLGVNSTDEYEPQRYCDPILVVRIMAFTAKVITILEQGLHCYNRNRYRTLNKRISRLIRHSIQFITDHLEFILAANQVWPQPIPGETVLQLLSQYESVHRAGMLAILKHSNYGNWQSLPEIPTRLLSPLSKLVLLTLLIDFHYNYDTITDFSMLATKENSSDWYLNNLQTTIEPLTTNKQTDAVYLLTAMSNLALDVQPQISSEMRLLTKIVNLLFQICYVIPATRQNYAKLGRELISTICLQHPQILSVIIENLKLWHPSIGHMGLFLLRELPLCLMLPSESEYRLLSSWLTESPNSICNKYARYIFSNLNWGFSRYDESNLYLSLSMHQKTGALLVNCYNQHSGVASSSYDGSGGTVNSQQQQISLINETMKMIRSLWWMNSQSDETSFAAWCLGLVVRLRLHPVQRVRVTYQNCLQQSDIFKSPEWATIVNEAQQDRCTNPVAMYVTVACRYDYGSQNNNLTMPTVPSMLSIILRLVNQHQQHRLALELLFTLIQPATASELNLLQSHDRFRELWHQLVHADNTYYNMMKSAVSAEVEFPGPVLSCLGRNFVVALILNATGDYAGGKLRQEDLMNFFIHTIIDHSNWCTDQYFLWLLDTLLELDTVLKLSCGSKLMFEEVKKHHETQWKEGSKRSAISQFLRLGGNFISLSTQIGNICSNRFPWLHAYLVQGQLHFETQVPGFAVGAGTWPVFCYKFLAKKKKKRSDSKTVTEALSATCKQLKLTSLTVSPITGGLGIVQAALAVAHCPMDNALALYRLGALFFTRYLGPVDVWDSNLIGHGGSVGYQLFQDDICLPILMKCRANIAAARAHFANVLDGLNQSDLTRIETYKAIVEMMETFLLWIDEPKLHVSALDLSGLPNQFRADILNSIKQDSSNIVECIDTLGLPVRILMERFREYAAEWSTRHDLDHRFMKLAEATMTRPVKPLQEKMFHRFQRQVNSIVDIPGTNVLISPNFRIQAPNSAVDSPSNTVRYVQNPLDVVFRCASKYRGDKTFMGDVNRRYVSLIGRKYERQAVSCSVQAPCPRGAASCSGQATIALNYYTWIVQGIVTSEMTRNRHEFFQLLDDTIAFNSLQELIKSIIQIEYLIRKLEENFRSNSEKATVVNCAVELFYHLGEQMTAENQKYPPFQHLIRNFMNTLGSVFLPHATKQAPKLLRGMLANELLVDVYSDSFCPTIDVDLTAQMYLDLMRSYRDGRCNPELTCTILSKFVIPNFLNNSPLQAYKVNMVDSLCTSLTYMNKSNETVASLESTIEQMHSVNLKTMLSADFNLCLSQVLTRFRDDCFENRLSSRFWNIIIECIDKNTSIHNGEVGLSLDELRHEFDQMSSWLQKKRFGDQGSKCYTDGLYHQLDDHACSMVTVYCRLLHSYMYKSARSASENMVPWNQAIGATWDYFLQMFIPWLQGFLNYESSIIPTQPSAPSIAAAGNVGSMCFPWKSKYRDTAEKLINLAIDQLQDFLNCITNVEGKVFLLHCVLIWISNGLLSQKGMDEYHLVYGSAFQRLQWNLFVPTFDCVKQLFEVFMRSWSSEASKNMMIDIAAQMRWSEIESPVETGFVSQIFEFLVVVICRTRALFKLESVDRLCDKLLTLDWTNLPLSNYKKGMTQLVANLTPSIILSNESTIEGKFIKLLNRAAGQVRLSDEVSNSEEAMRENTSIQKQTVYVETVVRLLSVAFSFTQSGSSGSGSRSGSKVSNHESQTKQFQLRVSVLFTDIEKVVVSTVPTENVTSRNFALTILAEVMQLYRNQSIVNLALEPTVDWIKESIESPLILPFTIALFRWPPSIPPLVSLLESLLEAYTTSSKCDGSPASWNVMTIFARFGNQSNSSSKAIFDQQQQLWREAVQQNAVFTLVQQALLLNAVHHPLVSSVEEAPQPKPDASLNTEHLQARLIDAIDQLKLSSTEEKALLLLVGLFFRLMQYGYSVLASNSTSAVTSSSSLKSAITVLLRLSESKKSSGLLGKMGLGKKSPLSFEARVVLRALAVFLQAQIPTHGGVRLRPGQPGAVVSPDMVVSSRPPGEPLPTNKTFQNLEWLKSQRTHKEVSTTTRDTVVQAIAFICDPSHCLLHSLELMRLLCGRLWSRNEKILILLHHDTI